MESSCFSACLSQLLGQNALLNLIIDRDSVEEVTDFFFNVSNLSGQSWTKSITPKSCVAKNPDPNIQSCTLVKKPIPSKKRVWFCELQNSGISLCACLSSRLSVWNVRCRWVTLNPKRTKQKNFHKLNFDFSLQNIQERLGFGFQNTSDKVQFPVKRVWIRREVPVLSPWKTLSILTIPDKLWSVSWVLPGCATCSLKIAGRNSGILAQSRPLTQGRTKTRLQNLSNPEPETSLINTQKSDKTFWDQKTPPSQPVLRHCLSKLTHPVLVLGTKSFPLWKLETWMSSCLWPWLLYQWWILLSRGNFLGGFGAWDENRNYFWRWVERNRIVQLWSRGKTTQITPLLFKLSRILDKTKTMPLSAQSEPFCLISVPKDKSQEREDR